MLLVLGGVAGDRLVAELAQLDADLVGGDAVAAVADDGPVAAGRGDLVGRRGDLGPEVERALHRGRQLAQRTEQILAVGAVGPPDLVADGLGQQEAGGDLGVEGLRGGDAHLDVAPVGGEQHAVGLVGEVAPPPVHDGDDLRATATHEVDGAVGVGGRPRLADGHHQAVAHVATEAEARQLGREQRLDDEPVPDDVAQGHGEALSRDRGRALADDEHSGDAPVAQRRPQVVGHGLGRQRHLHPPVDLDELPAERLAERRRCLADLLEQEVGGVTPVDVARRDGRRQQLVGGDGELAAVVGPPGDPGDGASGGGVEHHDLTPGRGGVVGVGRGLTVEAQVARGLLDHAVGLARHQEGVLGHAHVEGLPAAAQGEQETVGVGRGARRDGDRPLERGHRRAEGLVERCTVEQVAGDEGRDDLRVGGDLVGDPEPLAHLQVGEVVDVAVEHTGDEGVTAPRGPVVLLRRQRVRVGLGDDPDARPARVAEHQHLGRRCCERLAEEVVALDRGPDRGAVVAELADLRGSLVDEAEMSVGSPGGEVAEERIGPGTQRGGDAGGGGIEPVAPHEHGDAGGVAAPHLEAVERRQRQLDRGVPLDQRPRRTGPGEVGDGGRGAQAIAPDRPDGVLGRDDRGVERLDVGHTPAGVVEPPLPGVHRALEVTEEGVDGGPHRRVVEQPTHAGSAAQPQVDGARRCGDGLERAEVGPALGVERRGEPGEQREELVGGGWGPVAAATDDCDDAAHRGLRSTGWCGRATLPGLRGRTDGRGRATPGKPRESRRGCFSRDRRRRRRRRPAGPRPRRPRRHRWPPP